MITDEQIRRLADHVGKTPGIGVSDTILRECQIALGLRPNGRDRDGTIVTREIARVRCAEIFNKVKL